MSLQIRPIDIFTKGWTPTTLETDNDELGLIGIRNDLAIKMSDLTTVDVNGTGVFDILMRTTKKHLQREYAEKRITGAEYAQVYLGALISVLQNATQFLLNEQQVERLNVEIALTRQQIVSELAQTDDSIPVGLGFNHIFDERPTIPPVDCWKQGPTYPPGCVPYAATGTYYNNSAGQYSANSSGVGPDSYTCLMSFWVLLDVTPISTQPIFISGDEANPGGRGFSVSIKSDGKLWVHSRDYEGVAIDITTNDSFPIDSSWHHVLLSLNTSNGDNQIYIDDLPAAYTAGSVDGIKLQYVANVALAGCPGSFRYLTMHLAEFWFNDEWLDLTVTENRRKFITECITPVDLTEYPTGVLPITYSPSGNPAIDNEGIDIGWRNQYSVPSASPHALPNS